MRHESFGLIINEWLGNYWHLFVKHDLTIDIQRDGRHFKCDHIKGFYMVGPNGEYTPELMNQETQLALVQCLPKFQEEINLYIEEEENGF